MSDKTQVTIRENGPLLIAGTIEILNMDGEVIRAGDRMALCRCGHSDNKPFCDGTHKSAGFEASGKPTPK